MNVRLLNIIFMGNPEFAVPALERLAVSAHRISLVVTGTDKRRGRGTLREPSPVKKMAQKFGITVLEVDDVRSPAFADRLSPLRPDLFVVVAYKILPPEVLSIPTIGSVNLHASLLPKYRGAAPIHWALINGEKKTGCTVFMLDEGMDTGLILNQQVVPVDLLETTGDVYERLRWMGADLLMETIDDISAGRHAGKEQGNESVRPAPRVSVDDARVDFHKDCMTVHNLIRGMSPFPGAWTLYEGKKIKLFRSRPEPSLDLAPGEVRLIEGICYAGCVAGCVALVEMHPEGRSKMSGKDFYIGTDGNVTFS